MICYKQKYTVYEFTFWSCGTNGSIIKWVSCPSTFSTVISFSIRSLTQAFAYKKLIHARFSRILKSRTSSQDLFTATKPAFPRRLMSWSGFATSFVDFTNGFSRKNKLDFRIHVNLAWNRDFNVKYYILYSLSARLHPRFDLRFYPKSSGWRRQRRTRVVHLEFQITWKYTVFRFTCDLIEIESTFW